MAPRPIIHPPHQSNGGSCKSGKCERRAQLAYSYIHDMHFVRGCITEVILYNSIGGTKYITIT